MPAWLIPALLGGASFLGGALSGRGKKQTETGTMAQTVTSGLSPAAAELQNALMGIYRQRLAGPQPGVPGPLAGYEAIGIQDINRSYDPIMQALENDLTRRGLAGSPVGGAGYRTAQLARAGDIGRFRTGIPLLERQLQSEDIASAMQMYGLMPRTQTMTGTTTGAAQLSGNMLGGAMSDLGTMLGYLYGKGAFGGSGTPKTTSPGGVWV